MTIEEFYKTQWVGDPETKDKYWKCAARFSYDDMIKFAQDYNSSLYQDALRGMFTSGFRIDFVVVHHIEPGVGKLLISPADMHNVLKNKYDSEHNLNKSDNGNPLPTPK